MPDEIVECVVAVLVDHGAVLLGKRHPARESYPGVWDIIGGHVESGEGLERALEREVREELGVDALEYTYIETVRGPNIAYHAYRIARWDGTPTNTALDEHTEIRWYGADELPSGAELASREYRDRIASWCEDLPAG
ncbi:MAG: NUDIX domain-containing protein [Chloroflexi bacterium]|nr:NUDIX domain-containing protein [Chloroflexota bacterium]MDA1172901.1 NUDIX domain-containing protein [Chloroflexota bacterium]